MKALKKVSPPPLRSRARTTRPIRPCKNCFKVGIGSRTRTGRNFNYVILHEIRPSLSYGVKTIQYRLYYIGWNLYLYYKWFPLSVQVPLPAHELDIALQLRWAALVALGSAGQRWAALSSASGAGQCCSAALGSAALGSASASGAGQRAAWPSAAQRCPCRSDRPLPGG